MPLRTILIFPEFQNMEIIDTLRTQKSKQKYSKRGNKSRNKK